MKNPFVKIALLSILTMTSAFADDSKNQEYIKFIETRGIKVVVQPDAASSTKLSAVLEMVHDVIYNHELDGGCVNGYRRVRYNTPQSEYCTSENNKTIESIEIVPAVKPGFSKFMGGVWYIRCTDSTNYAQLRASETVFQRDIHD